jgi:hypothetical protein
MSFCASISECFGDIFPPGRIRILGAGRFGRLAVERLKPRFPDTFLSVIDNQGAKVDEIIRDFGISGEEQEFIQGIGPIGSDVDTWLVPAVPVHVAFEWVVSELDKVGEVRVMSVPEDVASKVPNPVRGSAGTLYSSFSTFICPDYCSEPEEICTFTGKGRLGNLFDTLSGVPAAGFDVIVLRSWQLAPGVGGYPKRSLEELLTGLVSKPGKYLIATSCRCHGVMDALEWKS